MTLRTVTEPTLRALLSQLAARQKHPRAVVAVAAEARWNGDQVIDSDAGPARIVPCVSPLGVRAAMLDHADRDDEVLVLLTELDAASLGEEVLGRLWEGRLHQPTSWLALQELAKVDRLDPELASRRWLVELLVSVAPSRGYPPPAGGLLTVETAWRYAYRYALQLPVEDPALSDVIAWGQTDAAARALRVMSPSDRTAIAAQLSGSVSPAAAHIIGMAANDQGSNIIPTGLVVDVLWRDESDAQLAYARGQLINSLGHGHLDGAAARSWGRAAVELTKAAAGSDGAPSATGWMSVAEQQLVTLDAGRAAIESTVLPLGYTMRLERAGHALQETVDRRDRGGLETLESALTSVANHLSASGNGLDRFRSLQAAVRMARWLVLGTQPSGDSLAARARDYIADGGFLDAARTSVQGETVQALADATSALIAAIDAYRHQRDLGFAQSFAGWSRIMQEGDTDLLPIEHTLDRIVAPIAQKNPVLVLVVDGLSHAASGPLIADLERRGWKRQIPTDSALPPVLAVMPSVTRVSRTSLLCGELRDGGQAEEREGFTTHPGLRSASRTEGPLLFHRSDLGDSDGRVAPSVQQALLNPDQRIVGIVVNGADDHLAKGSQLRLVDGLSGIRPLQPIEQAAAECGRVIVLVADHGHVVDNGTTYRHVADTEEAGGERWRPKNSVPPDSEDEIAITGPRVLLGGEGGIIAAATERNRYTRSDKRGYHGGATPAEVLCPLIVLLPTGVTVDGWTDDAPALPEWWSPLLEDVDLDRLAASMTVTLGSAPERLAPAEDDLGRPVLFSKDVVDGASATSAAVPSGWISDLLSSPLLQQQRAMSGRASLEDHELASLIGLLVGAGGTLPALALANHLSLAPTRLRGKLDALRRLLNLDGYEVVEMRTDGLITINIELLSQQFGITPS